MNRKVSLLIRNLGIAVLLPSLALAIVSALFIWIPKLYDSPKDRTFWNTMSIIKEQCKLDSIKNSRNQQWTEYYHNQGCDFTVDFSSIFPNSEVKELRAYTNRAEFQLTPLCDYRYWSYGSYDYERDMFIVKDYDTGKFYLEFDSTKVANLGVPNGQDGFFYRVHNDSRFLYGFIVLCMTIVILAIAFYFVESILGYPLFFGCLFLFTGVFTDSVWENYEGLDFVSNYCTLITLLCWGICVITWYFAMDYYDEQKRQEALKKQNVQNIKVAPSVSNASAAANPAPKKVKSPQLQPQSGTVNPPIATKPQNSQAKDGNS